MKRPIGILAVLTAAVAILAVGGWMSANAAPPGISGATSAVSWCCANGSSPGITVTGQATVHGRGTSAREDAIARAVADATDQANAAAHAAGISLGTIVDMQVSAPAYPYPVSNMPVGAEPGSSGSGSSSSSAVSTPMCPASGSCPPIAIAFPYQVDASVTITWSIA